ncbi:hypothetical protein ACWEQ0_06610 [Nocardia thailandica]
MGGELLVLAAVVGPLALLGWAAVRAKHRGLGGTFAGPFQEMFDPGAARARIVAEERAELPGPADSGEPDGDDETPNIVEYQGIRLYIDPEKARRTALSGPGPDGPRVRGGTSEDVRSWAPRGRARGGRIVAVDHGCALPCRPG